MYSVVTLCTLFSNSNPSIPTTSPVTIGNPDNSNTGFAAGSTTRALLQIPQGYNDFDCSLAEGAPHAHALPLARPWPLPLYSPLTLQSSRNSNRRSHRLGDSQHAGAWPRVLRTFDTVRPRRGHVAQCVSQQDMADGWRRQGPQCSVHPQPDAANEKPKHKCLFRRPG
jgi:hypothetical protein